MRYIRYTFKKKCEPVQHRSRLANPGKTYDTTKAVESVYILISASSLFLKDSLFVDEQKRNFMIESNGNLSNWLPYTEQMSKGDGVEQAANLG